MGGATRCATEEEAVGGAAHVDGEWDLDNLRGVAQSLSEAYGPTPSSSPKSRRAGRIRTASPNDA